MIATCCVKVDDKGVIVVPLLIPVEQGREYIPDDRWITTQNSDRSVYRAYSVFTLEHLIPLGQTHSKETKLCYPFWRVLELSGLGDIWTVRRQRCRTKDLGELWYSEPWVLPEWDLLFRNWDLADHHLAWTGRHRVDISMCFFVCQLTVTILIFIRIKVLINDFRPHLKCFQFLWEICHCGNAVWGVKVGKMILHFAAIVDGDLSWNTSALRPSIIKDDYIQVLGHAPPLSRSIFIGVIVITELWVNILILLLRIIVATKLHGYVIDYQGLDSSSWILSLCHLLHERRHVVRYSQRAVVIGQADYLYSRNEVVSANSLGYMSIVLSQESRYGCLVIIQTDKDLHDLADEDECQEC